MIGALQCGSGGRTCRILEVLRDHEESLVTTGPLHDWPAALLYRFAALARSRVFAVCWWRWMRRRCGCAGAALCLGICGLASDG